MYCKNCNIELESEAIYCPVCGRKTSEDKGSKAISDATSALLPVSGKSVMDGVCSGGLHPPSRTVNDKVNVIRTEVILWKIFGFKTASFCAICAVFCFGL